MRLKGRLKLIAEMVPKCEMLVDVGTDHAYIPIYLVQSNKCKKAIASDVKEGPILSAKENIISYGLGDSIEARLGDGLEKISLDEMDVVVIAGMGGILITEILSGEFNKAKRAKALILQPMNGFEILREWLAENGFIIYDEGLASEGDKIYNVIASKWVGEKNKRDLIYYHIGEKLIEKKEPLLNRYINKRVKQIDKAISEMQSSGKYNPLEEEYKGLRNEMNNILKELET